MGNYWGVVELADKRGKRVDGMADRDNVDVAMRSSTLDKRKE